jgi:hypothetical protein
MKTVTFDPAQCNRHPLYFVWANMIQRCHTKTHAAFKWYGARGIYVCERWRTSFTNFCEDMGDRPPKTTIDRCDVDGPYEPENCRWASQTEQQRNRSNNKLTKQQADQIFMEAMSGAESKAAIARRYGISRAMVRKIADGRAWQ